MQKGEGQVQLTKLVAALALAVAAGPAEATTVSQLNLEEMVARAGAVVRGTVIQARPGTIRAGGGDLPVVTYRVRVDESFKGEVQQAKGVRYLELRMLGDLQTKGRGQVRLLLPDLPRLEMGKSYLLLTTKPSAIGMSSTVGLGQGLFRIRGGRGSEHAENAYGNAMLFRGMTGPAHERGPVPYRELATRLRGLVGREGAVRR
jgi:hypothetical protein